MKNILCYGDSNTWGFNPGFESFANCRYKREERWTGLLQQMLGSDYYVIEEGLGGRTTVFEDIASPGRSGLAWLYPCLQSHQPLDLVILMLGTNDTKAIYNAPVQEIARGMEELVKVATNPQNFDGSCPKVLLVSPILVDERVEEDSWLSGIFDRSSAKRTKRLSKEYERIALSHGCEFLDATLYAEPSPKDWIHLSPEGHRSLAKAFAERIATILE